MERLRTSCATLHATLSALPRGGSRIGPTTRPDDAAPVHEIQHGEAERQKREASGLRYAREREVPPNQLTGHCSRPEAVEIPVRAPPAVESEAPDRQAGREDIRIAREVDIPEGGS